LSEGRESAAAPAIEYRDAAPTPEAFAALFATTGWDPEGRLDAAAAAEALRHSWFDVSAYDGDRLVGMGRIVGDGVLHALLADIIVEPDYRGRGIGGRIVERLTDACRRHRISDVQLFCARGKRGFYERLGFTARSDDAPGMELDVLGSEPVAEPFASSPGAGRPIRP
jgi:GNAT superfamily N-acetyltransferase